MKTSILLPAAALALFFFMIPARVVAAETEDSDSLFVLMKNGHLDVFPSQVLENVEQKGTTLLVTAIDGQTFEYDLADVHSYRRPVQVAQPSITSFKFNNKFNYQVFTDADFEIDGDSLIHGTVAAIGRWLTPSFQLSDKRAVVYRDDTLRLYSKLTRVPFADEHTLTCAYPGIRILKDIHTQPTGPEETTYTTTEIVLTADMLSTNAPSNYPESEGLDKTIDDDPNTYYHSTWGSGPYEKLSLDENPYIEITLPDALHTLQYAYQNRSDTGSRSATAVCLMASTDGEEWEEVNRFTTDEGLSPEQGAINTSPVIQLEKPSSHFRLVLLQATYKNYFCVAELKIYQVTEDQPGGQPADYSCAFVPFGRQYQYQMQWLADSATTVPRINIDILDGGFVNSREDYLEATISIDGQGMFPDLDSTEVLIRGRGNSSWSSNPFSKNPYRLKFYESVKPFGLTKGKSWVLQGNRQKGSMLTNPIGMYAAGIVGVDGANHYIPVELYMNGMYWGSYTFTEKVGFHNNSIDLDDTSKAALLELDTYTDEPIYYSSPGRLPVKIKDPDFNDPESSTLLTSPDDIMTRFNAFTALANKGEDISPEVDIPSLARFLMVNELIGNNEIKHPKSTYLYHEDVTSDTCRFKFGPIWDLDWSYGYEDSHTYYLNSATVNFWTANNNMEATTFLRKIRQAGEPLDREMYRVWTIFMQRQLDDLLDFCNDYYAYARPSLENNNNTMFWGDKDQTNYASNAANARSWLRQRARYVYARLTPYDLTDEELLIPDDDLPIDDYSQIIINSLPATTAATPTRFDVYDMRGMPLKIGASYNNYRDGLAPGLYIVNGKKVLIQ